MATEPAVAPPSARAAECGLSLVELMIATVVMVVGLVGIMNSCVRLHALQRLDAEVAQAYRACLRTLEELRTLPLASLPRMHATGFDVPGADGSTPALVARADDADGLPGAISVSLLASDTGRLLYRLTAAASWRGVSGDSAVKLSTCWGGAP